MSQELSGNILDDSQLLLLDALAYCFSRNADISEGSTLAQIVTDIDSGIKRNMQQANMTMGSLMAEQMTYAQWFVVIDAIRRDRALCQLTLDSYSTDERGARLACFSDSGNRAYVIIAGTGPGEWDDNCLGGYLADTEQQIRTLKWFTDEVIPRHYDRVVASGHSKGGNKAMYLAVQAGDSIDSAISFDGQGFSRQFLAAYADQIAEHSGKIIAYALDNDIVNGLLNPIAPPENRIYLQGESYDSVFAYHAPFALLMRRAADPYRLALRKPGAQRELGKVSVAFTDYLQTQVSPSELPSLCHFLGKSIESRTRSSLNAEQRRAELESLASSENLEPTVDLFTRFFKSIGKNVSSRDVTLLLLGYDPKEGLDIDTLAVLAKVRLPEAFREMIMRE
jgi:hypothetical protein